MTIRFEWIVPSPAFAFDFLLPVGAMQPPVPPDIAAMVPVIIGSPVGGGTSNAKIDVIAPVTNGQTVFALTAVPANPALVRMSVNGQIWRPPSFTVVGTTATWASAFSIQSTDEIEFTYTI